ncbi:hypothetical protein C8Q74DRAFT_368077 [Fomes fomentarius]|nr:hypothetical protein C8Q74DRAFT_368077 [Fomes fomentarius]
MAPRTAYAGLVRKLVLGIDVGTTYSGVSYAILDPGEIPQIQWVTRYPGQENAAGDSKIPSILYYRPDGTLHSAGAEAAVPGIELEAEDENLIFVQWFKLHLRPERLDSQEVNRGNLPPLPLGKTVLQVFADFLGYLFSCAQRYIVDSHASGESLWTSVKDRIEIVLSHPNGWEGLQQGKMREAAILAGLIPNTVAGRARVHFVTEGEASLQYCIHSGLASDSVKPGHNVMVIDAGGGTVDISSYSFTSTAPLAVEEIAAAECIMQGSTRVNVRAEKFLKDRLKESAYGNDGDIKSMLGYFEKATKPIFKDANESAYIKFGSMGCNDPKAKIRRGQLLLSGAEMESFFKPSLEGIVAAVERQRRSALRPVTTAFFVGGFAASPWLHAGLQKSMSAEGVTLSRPDTHTNKAVSVGAVLFYLDNFVSARVMRTTYGTASTIDFDPNDPEHHARRATKLHRPSGRVVVPEAFSIILKKGLSVGENAEIRRSYRLESQNVHFLDTMSASIACYKGDDANPRWMDVDAHLYVPLCTITADTSKVYKKPRSKTQGKYFVQEFDIVVMCGSTEMRALISWMENGEEKRSPAVIVYDDEPEELHV